MIGIYAIYRKSDDKCMYVGESKDIERRLYHHFSGHTHINVNKTEYYGKPIELHDTDDRKIRMSREVFWINELNPELNQIRDGSSWMKGKPSPFKDKHFSEETIEILKEKNRGCNNPMYGKPSPMRGKTPWNKGKKLNKKTGKYE